MDNQQKFCTSRQSVILADLYSHSDYDKLRCFLWSKLFENIAHRVHIFSEHWMGVIDKNQSSFKLVVLMHCTWHSLGVYCIFMVISYDFFEIWTVWPTARCGLCNKCSTLITTPGSHHFTFTCAKKVMSVCPLAGFCKKFSSHFHETL